MTISKVSEYNNEQYRLAQIKLTERRQIEKQQEINQTKQRREDSELKRIEMNRQMNRAGQNVDKLA
jgi:hypothetical protein